MAKSYVKQGTCVVCTNMTCGVPRKVGIKDGEHYVLYGGEPEQPILNCMDRKMSDSFDCKMPQKFWKGLAMLAVGIAFAAACIVTCGAAAVVVAAATTAFYVCAAGAIVTSGVALYKTSNDCDATLDSPWDNVHGDVFISGNKALLSTSKMTCKENGGIITIIIDPATAMVAAKYITSQNNQELGKQYRSQFLAGFLGGVTGGANIYGIIVLGGCYCYFEPKKSPAPETTVGGTLLSTGVPTILTNIDEPIKDKAFYDEMIRNRKAAGELENEAVEDVAELYRTSDKVPTAKANAEAAEKVSKEVGRKASQPPKWNPFEQRQAIKDRPGAQKDAKDAWNAYKNAKAARKVLEDGASSAAKRSAIARLMEKNARNGLFNSLGKGITSFGLAFFIEYFSNKSEDENQWNVKDYNKNIQDAGTIGIEAK